MDKDTLFQTAADMFVSALQNSIYGVVVLHRTRKPLTTLEKKQIAILHPTCVLFPLEMMDNDNAFTIVKADVDIDINMDIGIEIDVAI